MHRTHKGVSKEEIPTDKLETCGKPVQPDITVVRNQQSMARSNPSQINIRRNLQKPVQPDVTVVTQLAAYGKE